MQSENQLAGPGPYPGKAYFTGAKEKPKDQYESSVEQPLSSANLTSMKEVTMSAIVGHQEQTNQTEPNLLTDIQKKLEDNC